MVLPAVRQQFRLADVPGGKGGRSQELALAFADEMATMAKPPARWLILAGGTDGRDGPTDAAGAIIDSGSSSISWPRYVHWQTMTAITTLQRMTSFESAADGNKFG